MLISFKSDIANLAKSARLEQQQQAIAAQRALNAAARGLRTDAGRELKKRYPKLSTRDIGALIDVKMASRQNLQALVIARGRPLSLMRFKAGEVTRRGRGGVWVNVKGQRHFIPHAWVQSLKTKAGDDYEVIFIREGAARMPIKALKTIDIPNAMNIREVRDILDTLVHDRFDKEFSRQISIIG